MSNGRHESDGLRVTSLLGDATKAAEMLGQPLRWILQTALDDTVAHAETLRAALVALDKIDGVEMEGTNP